MCQSGGSSACGGLFDREYFEDMVAGPFRDGTIGEAPILPGPGLFLPAGTGRLKDKGLFPRPRSLGEPLRNRRHGNACTTCLHRSQNRLHAVPVRALPAGTTCSTTTASVYHVSIAAGLGAGRQAAQQLQTAAKLLQEGAHAARGLRGQRIE